ncbi:MAG: hypF [Planctomycetaceae bacterium]|nr:hypF [Planctomycetaceae bacterium]
MITQPSTREPVLRIARRIDLTGTVQGIGLRPSVARLATECGVGGCVSNSLSGVEITVEGLLDQIEDFLQRLPGSLPESAVLQTLIAHEAVPIGQTQFSIRPAVLTAGTMRTPVPRDAVVCPDCLAEVSDPANRRQGYPFTSCTQCGPRYSIVTAMPFERSHTEISHFPLCARCQAEFTDRADRRLHAETISCPDCGPQVWVTDRSGQTDARRNASIAFVIKCLKNGGIVAVRGIGGYQLLCDATNQQAVSLLRERKQRRAKPFAIMVGSLDEAERLADVDPPARHALLSTYNPIVLLPAKSGNGLASGLHPGLNTLGVMLPTTPLHWLLLRDFARPLVVTSGNLEGQPLETLAESAQNALRNIADLWLHHDRPIRQAVDDSVVRIIAGRPVTLRLARGLAPLQLPIDAAGTRHTVAVGGHQKSAVALSNGGQAILGPHLGDLDGTATRERFLEQVSSLNQLYRLRPEVWVHDLHPEFFSTQWARSQPGHHLAVQHHHAHIVAGMLEHGWLDREVLGVAFDGTGYGPDGTIWGGEFLRTSVRGFDRIAHLRTFSLVGNEAAIREPRRIAIALAHQVVKSDDSGSGLNGAEREFAARIRPLLDHPRLALQTSSAGRLFDGVASMVLGIEVADFEGRPAQMLEAISDHSETRGYSMPLRGDEVDWRPMVRELLLDRAQGVHPAAMAMRFHRGLATAIAAVCGQFADLPIVLGGGVFQNRLLVELVAEELRGHPQPVGLPGLIPSNDGGLAAGQLAIGLMAGKPD